MAKTLQFRRGTTAELSSVTGAVGELFVDTTKDTVVVMDGSTAGGKPLATEAYVGTAVSNLIDAAPGALDTLNELAAALGDDANFATTVTNTIGVAGSYANSSYLHANSAYIHANSAWSEIEATNQNALAAGNYANSAFSKANTALIHAQAAYNAANTGGGGGGGGASTGYFTFTANTANVATGNNAVFNTSGFETVTFHNSDFWQISNLYHTNAPANLEHPNESFLKVWQNPAMGPNAQLEATALELIAAFSQLTAGITFSTTTAGGTYTGTIASIETGTGPSGDYVNIIFVEDFASGSGEYNNTFSYEMPISGQFTMDTDGTFITETLLAGELFVANNIITPVAGGSYGATVQPVVINGDLSVLGQLNPDTPDYTFFSGIVATPNQWTGIEYFLTKKNQKHLFVPPSMDGDSYYVNVYLPNDNEIGDTYEFVMYRNGDLAGNGGNNSLQVNLNTGTTNAQQDYLEYWNGSAFATRTQASFVPPSDKTGLMLKAVYVGYNRWTYFVTESRSTYS